MVALGAFALPQGAVLADDAEGAKGLFTRFGSYGRANVGFDADGNAPRDTNVIGHGPRLFEGSYVELEHFASLESGDGVRADVVMTLALFDPLAHYTGIYGGEGWALRNAYVRLHEDFTGISVWAGSRMYRGDDIYLLDYWPLDNLNTVGGGVRVPFRTFDFRAHVGVNRLEDAFQTQTLSVPALTFGSQDVVVLDRQRVIGSFRAQWSDDIGEDGLGMKAVAYAEAHQLPAGQSVPSELVGGGTAMYGIEESLENLDPEQGYVLGGQLGLFGFGPDSHLNLFARYASGLAAYGETGIPFGVNGLGSAEGASEFVVAFSGNWETSAFAVMGGGYLRMFADADGEDVDLDDVTEGGVVIRPLLFFGEHFQQGFEVSYQQLRPHGIDADGDAQRIPEVWQLSVMEVFSWLKGSYKRPQVRLVYTASLSNEAAQARFAEGDRRKPEDVEHFVGLSAEWWFNSSTY